MKKPNKDTVIIEKIQNEVNSVLEMHKSASDDWYRNRFSTEETTQDVLSNARSDCPEVHLKNFC
jgi:hypothetical protein